MGGDLARPHPESSHATAVAGIIGATGTAGSTPINGLNFVHADFRGAAYQCEIRAYDLNENYDELIALSPPPGTGENLLKRMRVSNHSYGPNNGWGQWDEDGIAIWDGDILQVLNNPDPEDYHFGLYNEDARKADDTAYALPYHLLVRAAGNESGGYPAQGISPSGGESLRMRINLGFFDSGWVVSYTGTGPGREKVYVKPPLGMWVKYTDVEREFEDIDGDTIPDNVDLNVDGDAFLNEADTDIDEDGLLNEQDPSPNGSLIGLINDPPPFTKIHTGFIGGFPPDGQIQGGYADSLPGGFTVCKNALCVGALGDGDTTLASYSGVGPTDDGRIKPDVVARGGQFLRPPNQLPLFPLLGSLSDTDYNYRNVGTSFAAPVVSGAVTLLSEWQEKLRSNKEPFRASTFKALICHTATNLSPSGSPPGPNFKFGWGRINAAAAAELIRTNDNRRNITEVFLVNSSAVASIKLRAIGTGPLGNQPPVTIKVTIAWTDPPGAVRPDLIDQPGSGALKHNINLKLIKTATNASTYPWKPNPATPNDPYSAATPATWTGENNRDTVEQVYIPAPQSNDEYEIRISSSTPLTAGTIPGQWVSVVMEGLFNPSTVADGTIIGATVATQSTYVVFTTVMGGYYRLQCQPYGGPWINIDAPAGKGLIRARSGLYTTWFGHNYGNTPVPLRIVKLSPNPFNLPP